MFSVSRDLVQEELVAVKQQLERWIEIFDNGRVPVEDVPTAEGNVVVFFVVVVVIHNVINHFFSLLFSCKKVNINANFC